MSTCDRRRPSCWLPLVLVLSLLLPSAAIWSQPAAPETSAAFVKPKHEKHDKDKKHPARKGDKHHAGDKPKAKTTPTNEPELVVDATPSPAVTTPKPTKKARKAARTEAAGVVSAAAFAEPAPAMDARMLRYYGAADGGGGAGNGAFFPWQFSNGFDRIEDMQRDVNGKASHWVITDCNAFCGWDIYSWRVAGGTATADPNWARFEVTRTTTVGYVHRDGGAPPAWLAQEGWVDSGIVDGRNPEKGWATKPAHVYTKEFGAGMITIPGPGSSKILPWILFAEAGGARPTMPAGYAPNQKCADALHDAYKSRDGWPTWHPNHDPKSWCYFGHDHGSDPRLVFGNDTAANMPEYGRVAAAMGMTENHWGHKGYAILHWPEANFYILQHFGTFGTGRMNTCAQRFHLVQVSARDRQGFLVYQVVGMLDFGDAMGVAKGGDNPVDDHPLNPPGCANGNAQEQAETGFQHGRRRIPIGVFFDDPNNELGNSYEPWRFAKRYKDTLGITDAFVINTIDPLTSIANENDFTPVEELDRSGTGRFLTINNTEFHCPTLPATQRNAQGYWWTDPMGLTVYDLDNRPASAVRQFCKPGWAGTAPRAPGSSLSAHLSGPGATRWGDAYVIQPGGVPGDFERSIQDGHGPNVGPIIDYVRN